jgi:glycosyltransferase involved in cell wall biosynthesis
MPKAMVDINNNKVESSKPAVSILICTTGQSKYFKDCLESIFQQTFKDWELLICVDGGFLNPDVLEIIDDPRVKLYKNIQNMGLPYSLNLLIKEASGDYVARMDDDDTMHKDRIYEQVEIFKSKVIDVCCTGANIVNEENLVTGYLPKKNSFNVFSFAFKNPVIHPSVMFKSQWIKSNLYDVKLRKAQDWELWLRTFERTKWYFIELPLINYRLHTNVDFDKRILTSKYQIDTLIRNPSIVNQFYWPLIVFGLASKLLIYRLRKWFRVLGVQRIHS